MTHDDTKMLESKRVKIILIIIPSILILIFYSTMPDNDSILTAKNWKTVKSNNRSEFVFAEPLKCYEGSGNVILELDPKEPVIGRSIFFLLTSCPTNTKDIVLNARQACAVESTALKHWDRDIYLLIVAPVGVELNETENLGVKALSNYPNVKIRHINFLRYLEGTPTSSAAASLQRSLYPVQHASDILRYTTLYRFRGLYLDLDIIMIKRLPQEVTDFVGAESQWSLGAGAISFGDSTTGAQMAENCADEFARSYNPKAWGHNGPGVITRVLFKRCEGNRTVDLWGKTCKGFKIYPPPYFYALPFAQPKLFFGKGNLKIVTKKVENSFLIHYWNKVTSHLKANESTIPFYEFANWNCPRVFDSSRDLF